MKHSIGRYIFFVLLLISSSCWHANASDVVCDPVGCISVSKLRANIVSKLSGNVVGFVVIVGSLPAVSGGQARTSTDPPETAMSPDLPMDIASLSKTLTAVAILQLLANNELPIDTKIWPYIYKDWTLGLNVNQITFKDLLRHTSGFEQVNSTACDKGTTYAALKALVAAGLAQAPPLPTLSPPAVSPIWQL
jgi:CubicO group peptidase (beta-lactamase class C family)